MLLWPSIPQGARTSKTEKHRQKQRQSRALAHEHIIQAGTLCAVVDRILEMKKGSRAAVSGKGCGPKPRQEISDITDFQKKEFWK